MRMIALLLACLAFAFSGDSQAQTPSNTQVWSACWLNASEPSGIRCSGNNAVCTKSAGFASCTYYSFDSAYAECYATASSPFACYGYNMTICYPMQSPPPVGSGDYGIGAYACYPYTPPSELRGAPQNLYFGEQLLNTESTARIFTFSDAGSQWIQPSTTSTTGPFRIVSNTCYGATLYNGDNCTITTSFTPTALGDASGSVTVRYVSFGDNAQKTVTLAMSGTGVAQYSGPAIGINPLVLNFPSLLYGVTSSTLSATITNIGFSPMNISSITTNPRSDFHIVSNTCPASLPRDGQCTVGIVFTPAAKGQRDGFISISSDAPGSPHFLPLNGAGLAPVVLSNSIDDSDAGGPIADDIASFIEAMLSLEGPTPKSGSAGDLLATLFDDIYRCPNPKDCTIEVTAPPLDWIRFDLIGLLRGSRETRDQVLADLPICQKGADNYDLDATQYAKRPSRSLGVLAFADIGSNLASPYSAFVLDPIHSGAGNKYHTQTDYFGKGAYPLSFTRTYNSLPFESSALVRQSIGVGWFSEWDRSVTLLTDGSVRITRGDGKSYLISFDTATNQWLPEVALGGGLVELSGPNGRIGWQFTSRDGVAEVYDSLGLLQSIQNMDGKQYVLTYDQRNQLVQVSNPFGRSISFGYDDIGRTTRFTDPAGGVTTYTYDAKDRLTSVTYPDQKTRQYRYEHTRFAFALTSIVDEAGVSYATFTYDSAGRATGNSFAGAVGTGTVSYSGTAPASTTTTADGTAWTRTFAKNGKRVQMTSLSASCTGCGTQQDTYTYDTSGRLTSHINRGGIETRYTYAANGRLGGVTRAYGTADAASITRQWHATLPRLTSVSSNSSTASYEYDPLARKTSETVTTATSTQSTTYEYGTNGMISRFANSDLSSGEDTTYTYDALGNIASATDAAGAVTSFPEYDGHGNPTRIVYPNGSTATLTYDVRGRIASTSIAGRTTTYVRNAVGDLASVTDADGNLTTYTYDAAHRLTEESRNGEKTVYTLDALGRATKTEVLDTTGYVSLSTSKTFDGLGRQSTATSADGLQTTFTYDARGNVTRVQDAGVTCPQESRPVHA